MVKRALGGDERAAINDIAERLKLEPHTVTGAASRAEEAGVLVREQCDQGRRRTWIRLTPEDERRLAKAVGALQAQRETLLAALDEAAAEARAISPRLFGHVRNDEPQRKPLGQSRGGLERSFAESADPSTPQTIALLI